LVLIVIAMIFLLERDDFGYPGFMPCLHLRGRFVCR